MFDKGINIKSQLHKSKICLGSLFRWLFDGFSKRVIVPCMSYRLIQICVWKKFICFEKILVLENSEAVSQRCFVKMMFLKASQNLQKSTCASVFLIKLQASAKFLTKTSFYRALPVEVPRTEIIIFAKNFHHKYVIGS